MATTAEHDGALNLASAMRHGFSGLACIKCGDEDTINVSLADTASFQCSGCDQSFAAADVRDHVDQWLQVLRWTASAPEVG